MNVFDFDGTIADTSPGILASLKEAFAELEVELKQGFREEVNIIGLLLSQAYGLEVENKSKFLRSKELGAK